MRARLASAYGLAVTGTLLLTTALFLVLARWAWHWRRWQLLLAGVAFGGLELIFFAANLAKVTHGGWLPLLIGVLAVTVMLTWQRGTQIVTSKRIAQEGSLPAFIDEMRRRRPPRVPGTAVFPHPTKDTTPLALRANVRFNGVLSKTFPRHWPPRTCSPPSSTSIRARPSISCPASPSRAARTTTCRHGRSGYSPGWPKTPGHRRRISASRPNAPCRSRPASRSS